MKIPVIYYDHPILRARESSLSDDRCQEIQVIGDNKISKMPLIYNEETLLSPMVWNSKYDKFLADYAKSLRKTDDAKKLKKVTTFVEMYFEIFKEKVEDVEMKEDDSVNEDILGMLKIISGQVEKTIEGQLQLEATKKEIEQKLEKIKHAEKLGDVDVEKLDDVLLSLATKNTQRNLLKIFTDLSDEKLNEIGDQSTPNLVSLLGDKVQSVKNSLESLIKKPAIERHPIIKEPITQGLNELYDQLDKPDAANIIMSEL
jgi:hypothetical protein